MEEEEKEEEEEKAIVRSAPDGSDNQETNIFWRDKKIVDTFV